MAGALSYHSLGACNNAAAFSAIYAATSLPVAAPKGRRASPARPYGLVCIAGPVRLRHGQFLPPAKYASYWLAGTVVAGLGGLCYLAGFWRAHLKSRQSQIAFWHSCNLLSEAGADLRLIGGTTANQLLRLYHVPQRISLRILAQLSALSGLAAQAKDAALLRLVISD